MIKNISKLGRTIERSELKKINGGLSIKAVEEYKRRKREEPKDPVIACYCGSIFMGYFSEEMCSTVCQP